jgi:hypothetical protein
VKPNGALARLAYDLPCDANASTTHTRGTLVTNESHEVVDIFGARNCAGCRERVSAHRPNGSVRTNNYLSTLFHMAERRKGYEFAESAST